MRFSPLFRSLVLASAALSPLAAFAHPGHDGGHDGGLTWDFVGGFGHPLGGIDHILAMVAVGLWAAQLGGRARWALPGAFLAALAAGSAFGANGFEIGFVEQAIAASVFVLGLLVVSATRFPLPVGMALAGAFAFFHGLAHGVEMPRDATRLFYGLGFLAATALLHGAGLGLGVAVARLPGWVPRATGAAVMAGGAWLLAS